MPLIVPASRADLTEVARVLASTFVHDTVMGSLITSGDREKRMTRLFDGLLRSGRRAGGVVDVARSDDGAEILGAAVWERPGRDASLLQQALELPSLLGALGIAGIRRSLVVQDALREHRPMEPHWYLAQIGVAPRGQGKGVGSLLLASRLDRIDERGEPAYLESSNERNRGLYRRFGFREGATIERIPGARPAAMWRPARASTLETR